METTNQNKEVIKKLLNAFETGNTSDISNFISNDIQDHNPEPGMSGNGIDLAKSYINEYKRGFPDLKFQVNAIVSEGDQAILHSTFTGTHRGEFWGIPASNKQVKIEGYDRFRIQNGKIAERWGIADSITLLNQIGVLPSPERIIEKAKEKEAVI